MNGLPGRADMSPGSSLRQQTAERLLGTFRVGGARPEESERVFYFGLVLKRIGLFVRGIGRQIGKSEFGLA